MTSFVLIEGFQYTELPTKAQRKVLEWLDECPIDIETKEYDGQVSYEYPSDWTTDEVQEHCMMNGYLFDRTGDPIHHLVLTEHIINRELNSTNNSNT